MRLIPGVAASAGVAIVPASSARTCLRSIIGNLLGRAKLPEQDVVCDTHDTKTIARGFNTMALQRNPDARICGICHSFVEPGACGAPSSNGPSVLLRIGFGGVNGNTASSKVRLGAGAAMAACRPGCMMPIDSARAPPALG